MDGVEKTWTRDTISLMRELGRDDSNTLLASWTGSLPIVLLSFSFVEFLTDGLCICFGLQGVYAIHLFVKNIYLKVVIKYIYVHK